MNNGYKVGQRVYYINYEGKRIYGTVCKPDISFGLTWNRPYYVWAVWDNIGCAAYVNPETHVVGLVSNLPEWF